MARSAQAVILAAGRGTRMKSAQAKVLHQTLGVPMLEHVLRSVQALGVDPVTVVVGHQADAVEAAFAGRGLVFVRQEPQRGTGHALQVARRNVEAHAGTLLVINGDVPLLRPQTLTALLETHEASDAAATILTVDLEDPGAYGRVLREPDGQVRAIVEARDASAAEREVREINAGIYVFSVPMLLPVLDGLRPQNAQGEYYLTDIIGLLRAAGRPVRAVKSPEPVEALGVNTMGELAEASRLLRQRRVADLMAAGVIVEDPDTTHVGLDVSVEPDAVIRPFTFLEGRTHVAAGAVVGPYARLHDMRIGVGAQVLDHCLLRESVVEAGAVIGPFAHIRPDSHVGARAKVGNFVELKKTRLGEGAKAPHLSYLGDATIGAAANIGAGTITCNYDGHTKSPTEIGAGAFVGSDVTLVAPVTVGEGAYVGAGSVITDDVPPGALALGRGRQVVKPGWAEERARAREKERAGKH
jgi:bifunctional UDP-N-acetylglucosamine pyrophosphorylase / glucosamine-1-phosphate N-acetyltransferase